MTKLAPHPGPGEPGVGRAVGVVRAPLTRRSRGRGGLRISRAPLRVAFWARGETGAAFGGTRRQQSRLGPRRGAAVGPCGPPVRRQHQGKTMPVEVSGPQRASGEAWRGSSLVEVLEERRRGPRKREDLVPRTMRRGSGGGGRGGGAKGGTEGGTPLPSRGGPAVRAWRWDLGESRCACSQSRSRRRPWLPRFRSTTDRSFRREPAGATRRPAEFRGHGESLRDVARPTADHAPLTRPTSPGACREPARNRVGRPL
jgi:hypothetical protein